MNDTAKKLRDITQNAGVTPGSDKPYGVIAAIKSAFGFDSILAAGVLLQFMAAIADELDELQARAAGANNLRQQLESAEKKAERRKQHIGYLETALHDKNALLEQRGGTIARLTAECSELRKQAPSERERQILAMWPRFEDGEPVMIGDGVDGLGGEIIEVYIAENAAAIWNNFGHHMHLSLGERVKRPAPKVLDADGVEIKVGDTVWCRSLSTGDRMRKATVTGFGEHSLDGPLATLKDEAGGTWHIDPKKITHTRPDSWERLEEDASKDTCVYFGGTGHFDCSECSSGGVNCFRRMKLDIVRRAKALAGVGVD